MSSKVSHRTEHPAPVVIVGAGPIGIETAVALKNSGVACRLFDSGSVGHTISWWAPQTRWFSSNERIAIAGVPLLTTDQNKATREQYLTYLRSVVTQFDLDVQTRTTVTGIFPMGESSEGVRFEVRTQSTAGEAITRARAVVLAIGGTDIPNRLEIPGEDLPHVDGYLRETHRYFGRRVLIVGGRNSAIEAALRLHHAGARVALSYRGTCLPEDSIKYWLLPEIKGLMSAGRIAGLLGTVPTSIRPDSVTLRTVADGTTLEVPADDVLSLIGYRQDKSLMRQAGVELVGEMQRPRVDESTMQTNVAGIYVAGTATAGTQSSKYKTFLENCHDHPGIIARHITGMESSQPIRQYERQIELQPES